MRILFSAYIVDPDAGSEPQCAWNWILGAVLNGHDVHILTTPDSAEKISLKIAEFKLDNLRVYSVPQPQNYRLAGHEINMYLGYLRWQKSLEKYAKIHQLQDIDIAHHLSWGNIGLGTGLSKMKIPYVLGPAGGGTVANSRLMTFFGKARMAEYFRTLMRKSYRYFPAARHGCKNAKLVLVANNATFNLARELNAERIQLFLPDGIDETEIIKVRKRPEKLVAVYVARFMPRKGATLAILAFAETLKSNPSAELFMVGDGPEMDKAVKLSKFLGVQNSIKFTGRINWKEVQEIYKIASVFVFSSLRDSSGAQVLEASAKGVPVVVLEESGISQWLPEKGSIKVELGKRDELIKNLSDEIIKVLSFSNSEWLEASKSISKFAAENSWKIKTSQMNQIYFAIKNDGEIPEFNSYQGS